MKNSRRSPGLSPLFLALLMVTIAAALSLWLQWPFSVTSASAPASEFSAERAVDSLELVLGAAGGPHPVGTPANARVHEEVIRQLESAGWIVERQRGVGCRGMRTCAAVENLIARRPGHGTGPAVVVACHTDSVPAAPGAGDDGTGVAVTLELARNLAARPATQRPVVLLLDEGEEMGLLGAELYTRRLEAEQVGAVINLEARGTEGPVWFFEVSDGGGALVSAYARSVARPSTSSIAYAVYRRMPNDTDLTVFKGAGVPGLGLAFIDGGARYHTPRDDLEHLSTPTVQRMGDSTLALVLELADGELPVPGGEERVFFDVANLVTVSWPAEWSWIMATLSLVLVLVVLARGRDEPLSTAVVEIGRCVMAIVVGGGVGWLVLVCLESAGALGMKFPENLSWASATAAVLGVASAFLIAALGRRRAPWSSLEGSLLTMVVLAAVTAWLEPAACYPFLLAALLGASVALVAGRERLSWSATVASLVLALTLVSIARVLPVGLGPLGLVAVGLLSALIVSPLFCLLPKSRSRWVPGTFLALIGVLLGGLTLSKPGVTEDSPRPLSITAYSDPASGESRALFRTRGEIPEAIIQVSGAPESFEVVEFGSSYPSVEVEPLGLGGIEVEVLERSEDRLRLHLHSVNSSWGMVLLPPPETLIKAVTWPGLEERRSELGVKGMRLQAVPAEGIEVELEGELRGVMAVVDRGLGLPAAAEALASARPPWSTPIGSGDRTEVWTRLELEELQEPPAANVAAPSEENNESL